MVKRKPKKKRAAGDDFTITARRVVEHAIGEPLLPSAKSQTVQGRRRAKAPKAP